MKNRNGKITAAFLAVLASVLLASCYAPSPLYGTWADNRGNRINFTSDGSYNATMTVSGVKEQSGGTYNVLKNIITFTRDTGSTTSTEWDIRGNILYLNWVDSNGYSNLLQLYKIAN